jgi:CRISPR/Cas system CSM-associated protein Csm3 (group 7 of RAMP superfamily)
MVALDEQFGGPAGGSLASSIGVKAGTEFKGEITGINMDQIILGGLYDVVKASEIGFIKFGRHRSRGFGKVNLTITKLSKYSVAPFKEEETWNNEKLKSYLENCLDKYSFFAKTPSEPKTVNMKLVEQK